MLEEQLLKNPDRYNEVVLDVDLIQQALPKAVEAFFYWANANDEEKVRTAHRNFLEQFQLSSLSVPLLRLDLSNTSEPFSCMVCGS